MPQQNLSTEEFRAIHRKVEKCEQIVHDMLPFTQRLVFIEHCRCWLVNELSAAYENPF